MAQITWQILGAGAIGCLFAAKLKQQGEQVHLVLKPNKSTSSLTLVNLDGKTHRFEVSASDKLQRQASVILVCLKAWQVTDAIKQHLTNIHPDSIVVLLHNGMGTLAPCQALLPHHRIWQASTTHGALLESAFAVRHTGQGETLIGHSQLQSLIELTPAEQPQTLNQADVVTALDDALPASRWSLNIGHAIWTKLVINCAINPLTALQQVRNGILAEAHYRPSLQRICQECCAVANADGVALKTDDLLAKVEQVIHATANNYSSMNRDFFYQRPTENDYILGYVIARAKALKITVSTCQTLYQELQHREHTLCQPPS
ncbi:ketopantoate reductase family protein [Motilimonas pumila]|nr:2-dehydropantoate 2-reductase [Motilimonas pumila]